MKKNLMSVLILALLVVNLVMTSIMMVSIVPSAKQSNLLITEICTALDLELASGRTANLSSVPIENVFVYDLKDSMTINLKDSEDGTEHYLVLDASISMDKTHEDYEANTADGKGDLSARESLIKDIISDVVRTYTMEEMKASSEDAKEEVLKRLQGLYDSDFIIGVSFTYTIQ